MKTAPMQIAAERAERTNGLLKNGLLLLFSIILSLVMGEVLLRAFTPFPIGNKSHRIPDPDLGYRLSGSLHDADEYGFRNPAGQKAAYRIAAIGDSYTYGNNVGGSKAWPALLEGSSGLKTYNFGIGGFGIYSYHALVSRALKDGAKDILVALFPANDFGAVWSHCDIAAAPSAFWRNERARLQLESLAPPKGSGGWRHCLRSMKSGGWKTWIVEHSAIASAVRMLVIPAMKRAVSHQSHPGQSGKYFVFPDGIPPISRKYVAENAALTDFAKPETVRLFDDFGRFTEDWSKRAAGRIGILVVPSKERVIFEVLRRHGALHQADPFFIRSVEQEIVLEHKVVALAHARNIPVEEAIGPMSIALEDAIRREKAFYPENDGHPYRAGYAAIAATGVRLLNEMQREGAQ